MFHNKAFKHCIRLCLLLVLFAGCAKAIPTPEPVTIKFPYYERDAAHYTTLAEQFKARYPNITVELVEIDRQNSSQMTANDVFIVDQLSLPQLIQQGTLLNLTPLIEQDNTFDSGVFYPGALETFQSEGKTWGIPSDINMIMMYYSTAPWEPPIQAPMFSGMLSNMTTKWRLWNRSSSSTSMADNSLIAGKTQPTSLSTTH
jgi:ABC-type glycerol-3-phosphate transport system substrate-binding protein